MPAFPERPGLPPARLPETVLIRGRSVIPRPSPFSRFDLPSRSAVFAFALLTTLQVTARAAEPPEGVRQGAPPVHTSLSVWQSTGSTTWSHDASASQPLFGNPTSRLEYSGVDSTIIELRVRVDLSRRWIGELAYGAGEARGGELEDADFLSAQGAAFFGTSVAGQHAYSKTVSDLSGDAVRYFEVKLNREMYRSPDRRSSAGVATSFLDWREQYLARGFTQTVCTAPNLLCHPSGFSALAGREVVSSDAEWRALFVGVWGTRRFGERVSVSGKLSYAPLANLDSHDRHLLRSDLAQSPSFRLAGNGQAATAELNATYRLGPRLTAGLGLRYWWMQVVDERHGLTVYPADAEPFSARLKSFESRRYGVMLNLTYALGGSARGIAR